MEWISVKDKLPELKHKYWNISGLVFVRMLYEGKTEDFWFCAYHYDEKQWFDNEGQLIQDITHWCKPEFKQ